MNTAPSTTITLYSCPDVDVTYANVMDFASDTYRTQYFNNLPHVTYNNCQYVRRGISVDLPIFFDDAEKYNYMIYNNNEGLGKEYAFIIDKEYINPTMTRFYIKYDIWNSNYSAIRNNLYNSKQYVYRTHKRPKDRGYVASDNDITGDIMIDYRDGLIGVKYYLIMLAVDPDHIKEDETSTESFNCALPCENLGYVLILIKPNGDGYTDRISSRNFTYYNLRKFLHSEYIYNMNIVGVSSEIAAKIEGISGLDNLSKTWVYADDVNVKIAGYSFSNPTFNRQTPSTISHTYTRNIQNISNIDDYRIIENPHTKYFLSFPDKDVELSSCYIKNDNNNTFIEIKETLYFDSSGIYKRYEVTPINDYGTKFIYIDSDQNSIILRSDSYSDYKQNQLPSDITNSIARLKASATNSLSSITGAGDIISSVTKLAGKFGVEKAAIDAKLMYAKAIPDTVRNATNISGKRAYEHINEIVLRTYTLSPKLRDIVLSEYYKYGYIVNDIETLNLTSRDKYNYVKLKDYKCNFIRCIDEKIEFENIMNSGVTIWHNHTGNINEIHYGQYTNNNENFYIE